MSSLESAIRILHCLSPETPRLRVSELAERLNMPKSTVSRLLKTLSEGGVLDRDSETREYVAGPVALQLGGLYMARHDLLDLVDDAVRKMVDLFGFTGYVAVLDHAEAVVLRCRQGHHPLKFVLHAGSRQPAAEASLGIGLLAQLDPEVLTETLNSRRRNTPHPSEQETRARIEQYRRQGWVEVPCLSAPEIKAIGAAVPPSQNGQPAIGFSISFPVSATDEALRRRIAEEVRAAACRLSVIARIASGRAGIS